MMFMMVVVVVMREGRRVKESISDLSLLFFSLWLLLLLFFSHLVCRFSVTTLSQQITSLLNDEERLKEARAEAKKQARKFEAMRQDNDDGRDDLWGGSRSSSGFGGSSGRFECVT